MESNEKNKYVNKRRPETCSLECLGTYNESSMNHSTAWIVASVRPLTQLMMYEIFRVSNLQKGTLMMIEYVTLDD